MPQESESLNSSPNFAINLNQCDLMLSCLIYKVKWLSEK